MTNIVFSNYDEFILLHILWAPKKVIIHLKNHYYKSMSRSTRSMLAEYPFTVKSTKPITKEVTLA
jgi:hypothetical protein